MNVNKPYDRKIVAGVARYVQAEADWGLYCEEEPMAKMPNLRSWNGDGIIADFDDISVVKAVRGLNIPVVGVGGGYGGYSPDSDLHYVATDHVGVARMAADHLLERGFTRFAYCGVPRTGITRWSEERAEHFAGAIRKAGHECSVYIGRHASARRWDAVIEGLTDWLRTLDAPVGLFAANDARARHVLEAARRLGIGVPEEVAVLGVDNDPLMCELAVPPLSSVIQGTDQIGYEAAAMLDRLMQGKKVRSRRLVIPPVSIATRQSTDILAVDNEDVARAVRLIQDRAGQRISVTEVVRHSGLSRSTLDTRFKQSLGRTVHDEIQRVQIALTQQLLRTTDLPLSQVATRAGYNNVQYMTMVFKRELGQTPGQYRKTVLAEKSAK